MEETGQESRPLPVRRIAAGLIDNMLIIAWALLLAVISLSLGAQAISDKRIAYPLALLTLTIPVVVTFALFESGPWRATPGKRLIGLSVVTGSGEQAGLARALLRNLVKFAPWEVAHIGVWLIPGAIFQNQPGPVSLALSITGQVLALIWLLCLFVGSGRTPPDRLSGLTVVKRRS